MWSAFSQLHACHLNTILFYSYVVYNSLGYLSVVAEAAEASMNLAVHEIQELPDYAEKGEVRIIGGHFGG